MSSVLGSSRSVCLRDDGDDAPRSWGNGRLENSPAKGMHRLCTRFGCLRTDGGAICYKFFLKINSFYAPTTFRRVYGLGCFYWKPPYVGRIMYPQAVL